ncbi:MAG: urease accessory UreF family protein [Pseudomonadota bacterium]
MPVSPPAAAELAPLLAWLSAGYPTGAFAYSHGLETAIAAGRVTDAASLMAWLTDVIQHGAGRADTVLLAEAMADTASPAPDLRARALAASQERLTESLDQGRAFAAVTATAWDAGPGVVACLPVALGRAAAGMGLDVAIVAPLALQAAIANLVSAAVRLLPLGQTEAQTVLAALVPVIQRTAADAVAAQAAAKDDPIAAQTSACLMGDIAAMRHETLEVRLFRS